MKANSESLVLNMPNEDSKSIKLAGLPMPPSVNNMYKILWAQKRHAATNELKAFKKNCKKYAAHHADKIPEIATYAQMQIQDGFWIVKFSRIFYFDKTQILTKKGLPKKIDVANYTKALDDAVCDMLGFDDKYIFVSASRKVINEERPGTVDIFIEFFKPKERENAGADNG